MYFVNNYQLVVCFLTFFAFEAGIKDLIEFNPYRCLSFYIIEVCNTKSSVETINQIMTQIKEILIKK